MSVTVSVMPDLMGSSVTSKLGLSSFRYVGGYVSGSGGIEWTAQQWAAIKPAVGMRIYQGHGAVPDLFSFDEVDVESGAVTVAGAVAILKDRVDAGIVWTNFYGSRDTLKAIQQAGSKLGNKYWIGHARCRLADWNLSRVEAEALVGTEVEGMTCYGVQWASPSSNPNTIMPGPSGLTLKQANVDLSVIDVRWEPTPGKVTTLPTGKPVTLSRIVAEYSDGSSKVILAV